MAIRFFKQSEALEDYDFDWSGWLVDGDFITSYKITADDGVTLGDVFHQVGAPIIKQFVSGGTHGNSYKITCKITTDQGRSDVAQIIILIRDYGTGGQPIPPGDEMTVLSDISDQVSFQQIAVTFHPRPWAVVAIKTGPLVTVMFNFFFDFAVDTHTHIEMILPDGFQGKESAIFASSYFYHLYPNGPNMVGGVYIEPDKTGSDRLALYPFDWTTFPQSDNYYLTGQITYVTPS